MEHVFINEAFTQAINDYLKSVEQPKGVIYNSFLVIVIRMLIVLYSELDIVNPLVINDEDLLKSNLTKYGFSKYQLDIFFSDLQVYYDIEKEQKDKIVKKPNPYFISVQKLLIDMLIAKKLNFQLKEKEVQDFYNLLYTPYSPNPLQVSYNFLMAEDVLEIDRYFRQQMKENVKQVKTREKHYLNVKAYELLNYSMNDLYQMDANEVDKINSQVYDYFKIRENAINKEYLLDKAIEAIERENNKVTSGNGYVDILLVLSIICTIIMVVGILTFIII
ncbi:MAG: hypothetical protein ACLUFU_05440 [Bacilli bacterium]